MNGNAKTQMAGKQPKFDQQLAEELKNLQSVQTEGYNMKKLARQNETKCISLQNQNSALEDRLAKVGLLAFNCSCLNFSVN